MNSASSITRHRQDEARRLGESNISSLTVLTQVFRCAFTIPPSQALQRGEALVTFMGEASLSVPWTSSTQQCDFCDTSGVQVYGVDYKLAPEFKRPTRIEEVELVLRCFFEHGAERGVDPNRIGLGGDSAGGNIACTVCLKLRDEDGPKLALQVPIYPEAEMPFLARAGVENVSGGYVDTAGVLIFIWSLVPQGVDYSQPHITPTNAPSHAGLPRTLLVTAGFDMLRDVAHQYAQKLAKDGNDITYVHNPDLSHAFIQMTAHLQQCLEATLEIARLIGDRLIKP